MFISVNDNKLRTKQVIKQPETNREEQSYESEDMSSQQQEVQLCVY